MMAKKITWVMIALGIAVSTVVFARWQSSPGSEGEARNEKLLPWIPEVEGSYKLTPPYRKDGPLTPDYGGATTDQVVESMQMVFRAVRGTTLKPGIPLAQQHQEYQKKVDQVIQSLPYKPNDVQTKIMRNTADATAFMATWKSDTSVPRSAYYRPINAAKDDYERPTSGKSFYEQGIAQKIIDNGTRGTCWEGFGVFAAQSHLSGIPTTASSVILRSAYGNPIDISKGDTHVMASQSYPAREPGRKSYVHTDPTTGTFQGVNWNQITRIPNPHLWFVGATGDSIRPYFTFLHPSSTALDVSYEKVIEGNFPTGRQMAAVGSLPGLDPVDKAIKDLNREILKGN